MEKQNVTKIKWIKLDDLIAEWEKDPEKKAELDRARKWVKRNPLKPEDMKIKDLIIEDGQISED